MIDADTDYRLRTLAEATIVNAADLDRFGACLYCDATRAATAILVGVRAGIRLDELILELTASPCAADPAYTTHAWTSGIDPATGRYQYHIDVHDNDDE